MKNLEVLAPAGSWQKLKTAFYFGADAVYFGGKDFSLRAFAQNFDREEMAKAIEYAHSLGKKAYVTLNVFFREQDFATIGEYVRFLEQSKADAVIVSDLGIAQLVKEYAPKLGLHISTQANTTNKYAARVWQQMGAERIILARELRLGEIFAIKDFVPDMQLEAFVHGAMCMSYSGRCLLSDFFTSRAANRGECAQACRWNYAISELNREGEYFPIEEDSRGTYILNSKDLCLINKLQELSDVGVDSFKIEGRMKTEYYVATIVNAYARAKQFVLRGEAVPQQICEEVYKTAHRSFCEGFLFEGGGANTNLFSSQSRQTHDFVAYVLGFEQGRAYVEQRNKFVQGDVVEILSPSASFNQTFEVESIQDEQGTSLQEAKNVQQRLWINCPYALQEGDILRRKN